MPGMPNENSMRWDLHGLTLAGEWQGEALGERWRATFASRPAAPAERDADVRLQLAQADEAPAAPAGRPDFQQGELLAYYVDGADVVAHFPRYGQLRLDLQAGHTQGRLAPAALTTHGVFEDLLAIGLSPHLRRRGLFLLHAFAAAPGPGRKAALLVGDIGAGKTTTGLALLQAGWKLLSNDSPLVCQGPQGLSVLAYPGLISAYPDSLRRFAGLPVPAGEPGQKTVFAAEAVFPGAWAESAAPGAIVFPRVEQRAEHRLEPMGAAEALREILPHAIEQWDRGLIAGHLRLLNALVQAAPAYRLRLGPEVGKLPGLIAGAVS
jgi:hypothetical protein